MAGTLRPRGGRLWTSAEAASAFRVGVSSIKRWTDDGLLESVRTPGGHRRYTLKALHRFASSRRLPVDLLPPLAAEPQAPDITLYEALVRGDTEAVRTLVAPAQQASFLDHVVAVAVREIGDRWALGECSIADEHRASAILIEAIDRLRPPIAQTGRLALLACPPGERHVLPLHLVRLVLEWAGWRTELIGADVPWESVLDAVDRASPALVAFTSRSATPFQTSEFSRLVAACGERGTTVVVGGEWARGGGRVARGYPRFRSLRGFERWLGGRQPTADDRRQD